jgi:hypothetical protein
MRWLRRSVVAVAAVAAVLAVPTVASASIITSGELRLEPDPATFEGLADMGITVEATGEADFDEDGLSIPFRHSGVGPPPHFRGIIDARGGLLFSRADGAELKLKHPSLKIGNEKVKVAFSATGDRFVRLTSIKNFEITGDERRFQLKGGEASLSKPAAEVLSDAFDFPFRRGIPLGTASIKAKTKPAP